MLFGVNTLGGPQNIVLHRGHDPPTDKGRGPTYKFWNPLGPNENYAKVGHRGSEAGSRHPPFKVWDLPGTAEARDLKFFVHIEDYGP